MKGKNVGKKRTEEQSRIQSLRQTGKTRISPSEETRQKIRTALLNRDTIVSEETRQKISQANKGKPRPKSKEQVEKQRQSLLRYYENKKQMVK